MTELSGCIKKAYALLPKMHQLTGYLRIVTEVTHWKLIFRKKKRIGTHFSFSSEGDNSPSNPYVCPPVS